MQYVGGEYSRNPKKPKEPIVNSLYWLLWVPLTSCQRPPKSQTSSLFNTKDSGEKPGGQKHKAKKKKKKASKRHMINKLASV